MVLKVVYPPVFHLGYALASLSAPILPQLPASFTFIGTVKIPPLGALHLAVATHKLRNQMYEDIKIYLFVVIS